MAGTVVRDATGPNLATGATLNAAGDTTGSVVDLQYPCHFAVYMSTGSVTGTSPTLDVTIQAADNSAFNAGVVDIAAFPTVGDEDNAEKHLRVYTTKRYVRAAMTLGGTSPNYSNLKLQVVPFYDRHSVESSA